MNVVFLGTPEFAVPTLQKLSTAGIRIQAVFTRKDKKVGRHQALTPPPVKVAADKMGLPIYQPSTLKKEANREPLVQLCPDAIVVVAYGMILPPYVLSIPRLGCINLHPSLLPAFRGAAPINWALIQGEKETGITTMLMDEGLDTGPVLLQRRTAIHPDEDAGALSRRLALMGADLMAETLQKLDQGILSPAPQEHARATGAPMLKKEDGKIDWTMGAFALKNRIRGLSPWPGSFCFYGGKRIKVLSAEVAGDVRLDEQGRPGEIVAMEAEGILIRCGENSVLTLKAVQMEGKKPLAAAEFLRGVSLKAGDILA